MKKSIISLFIFFLFTTTSISFAKQKNSKHNYPINTIKFAEQFYKPHEVEWLNLPRKGFTKIPESIRKFNNLKILNLDNNKITHIPPWIKELKNLRVLNLNGNRITDIPPEIKELDNLRKLNLYNNKLTHLPDSIGEMKNLEVIKLNHNKIDVLPESIGKLKNLKELYLSGNPLKRFPSTFKNLSSLKKLELSCGLTELPETVTQLKNLEVLDLSGNKMEELPESIGDLKNLKELILYGNYIKRFPFTFGDLSSLEKLNLASMGLTEFPEPVTRLKNLKEIEFGHYEGLKQNKILKIPETIENLINLEKLEISGSGLLELPDSIKNLKNLKVLNINFNFIQNDEIARLKAQMPGTKIKSEKGYTGIAWINSKNGLRMRSKPSLKGKKLGVIPYDSKITTCFSMGPIKRISGRKGRWMFIKWRNRRGWVFNGFITQLTLDNIPRKFVELTKEKNSFVIYEHQCSGHLSTLEIKKKKNQRYILGYDNGTDFSFLYVHYSFITEGNTLRIRCKEILTPRKDYKWYDDRGLFNLDIKFYNRQLGIIKFRDRFYVDERNRNKFKNVNPKCNDSY